MIGAIVPLVLMDSALHLEPLHADDWAIAGIGSLLVGALPLLFAYARSTRRHMRAVVWLRAIASRAVPLGVV